MCTHGPSGLGRLVLATITAGLRATHGRGALGRLLFGSVAEAVLWQAEVPVFLMRQTKAQVATRAAWEAVR